MPLLESWPIDAGTRWPDFTEAEMACRCGCGALPAEELVEGLQVLRNALRFPMPVTSGMRCHAHNRSIGSKSNAHPSGYAADILCTHERALRLVSLAYDAGWERIGVKQHGPHDGRFVHIDRCARYLDDFTPAMWSYP